VPALASEPVLAPISDAPSIAVLPFIDMSPDRDQDYFCEGMAEEILNALTRIDGLRVAARTSSFQFKGRAADVRKVGQELGVRTVLEGSVRKAGSQLRVTAQLINSGDGYHLWSERYDRGLEDVFTIQDDIAARITEALKLRLTPQDLNAIQVKPTGDIQAYDYYLRGRQLVNQFGKLQFDVGFANLLCVPSLKRVLPHSSSRRISGVQRAQMTSDAIATGQN